MGVLRAIQNLDSSAEHTALGVKEESDFKESQTPQLAWQNPLLDQQFQSWLRQQSKQLESCDGLRLEDLNALIECYNQERCIFGASSPEALSLLSAAQFRILCEGPWGRPDRRLDIRKLLPKFGRYYGIQGKRLESFVQMIEADYYEVSERLRRLTGKEEESKQEELRNIRQGLAETWLSLHQRLLRIKELEQRSNLLHLQARHREAKSLEKIGGALLTEARSLVTAFYLRRKK